MICSSYISDHEPRKDIFETLKVEEREYLSD